ATAARNRHSARVRRLWGRDRKGRFRTKGRSSHATVRGTVWLVEDRCDGTHVRVRRGAVEVRPVAGGHPAIVSAGEAVFVPAGAKRIRRTGG
ncbi:MAG: hypothetical protein M3N16_08245, partial [Actinomycetota bacterium]|nr:hypothetical protein [Actinomycetota bacterium]